MNYPFAIRHSLPGRTRIRWSGETDQRDQVEVLAPRLAELPGIDNIDARRHSGSIVIEHESVEWCDLELRLRSEFGMNFEAPEARPRASGLDRFNQGLGQAERELRKFDIDLGSLVFLFLLVMAVAQAARGQYGASGFSFLWYALSVASHRRDRGDAVMPPPAGDGDSITPI